MNTLLHNSGRRIGTEARCGAQVRDGGGPASGARVPQGVQGAGHLGGKLTCLRMKCIRGIEHHNGRCMQIEDSPGLDEVTLTRKFGNEECVCFHLCLQQFIG